MATVPFTTAYIEACERGGYVVRRAEPSQTIAKFDDANEAFDFLKRLTLAEEAKIRDRNNVVIVRANTGSGGSPMKIIDAFSQRGCILDWDKRTIKWGLFDLGGDVLALDDAANPGARS